MTPKFERTGEGQCYFCGEIGQRCYRVHPPSTLNPVAVIYPPSSGRTPCLACMKAAIAVLEADPAAELAKEIANGINDNNHVLVNWTGYLEIARYLIQRREGK